MSGHTPGPWEAQWESERWVILHEGPYGPRRALAVTAGSYPAHDGNARLIAAAPELLEALRIAVMALAHASEHHKGEGYDDAYGFVSAAIAKATQP